MFRPKHVGRHCSNRSSFPASFFSRLSMSLSYRESKWSEALLNTLIVITQVLLFQIKVYTESLNLFLIFSLSLDVALN
jgi:hypothetical protein